MTQTDTEYICPRCGEPAPYDEEGTPRCRNMDCPRYMTIVDQFLH